MKSLGMAAFIIGVALFSGCVSTTYTKTVSVTKDSAGRIVQTVETETVIQPNQSGWPVKFQYLNGVQVGNNTGSTTSTTTTTQGK